MRINGKEVTKEWHNCPAFEEVINQIRSSGKREQDLEFSREELKRRINEGEFGTHLVATYSPAEGSVEEILMEYKCKGKVWLDIQNLTYHYSHQNPNGNFHSHRRLLRHIGGRGYRAVYRII